MIHHCGTGELRGRRALRVPSPSVVGVVRVCLAALAITLPNTRIIRAQSEYAGRGAVAAFQSVYRLYCPDQNRRGSAFGHASGRVITAEHLVRDCDRSRLVVVTASGAKTGVREVVTDRDLDLALLTPETADFVEGPFSVTTETRFSIGAQVTTWGYPDGYSGDHPLLSVGHLAGVEELQSKSSGSVRKWVVNGAFNLGNSGGPVLDTKLAVVIGVVSSKATPIPADLKKALEDLASKGSAEGKTIAGLIEHLRMQTQLSIGQATMSKDLRNFLSSHGISP